MPKNKGILIVIEGTDGSGKATQSKILIQNLKKTHKKVAFLDFPQYGKPTCASVEKYLNGEYGSAKEVGPYRASIFYAVDRFDASFKLKKWLSSGFIVIANRYVASNLAHQGSKITNSKKRKIFFEWIQNLEFKIFQIPRPDINIILFVDAKISHKLIDNKEKRNYLKKGKRDIHEKNIQHLLETQRVYKQLISAYPRDYTFINCVKNNTILSREEIAKKIKKIIDPIFK